MDHICVLGAGSWGTALALLAARNGVSTYLWGHRTQHIADLLKDNCNHRYLPGFAFPSNLTVTDNLTEAVLSSDIILLAVPSHVFKQTLQHINPVLRKDQKIAWATKGFCPDNGHLLHIIAEDTLSAKLPVAVLSGPTFAQEVAQNLPTAITIASPSQAFTHQLTSIFHNQYFRTYSSQDMVGVQVGGAVKNVLAIAAGIADGLGFGANTRSALITRGLNEIIKLGIRLGGQAETFMGLAGLGDLILTCTDDKSRNRRFGLALGKGQNIEQALSDIGQEVEGYPAARETYHLAQRNAIEMPITEQTYQVLYNQLPPRHAVENLLNRALKAES